MKRRYVVLLHAGYWTVYLLLITVVLAMLRFHYRQAPSVPTILFASPIGFLSIVPNLVAFYLAYEVLFRHFLERRRLWALLLAGAGGSVGSAALGELALYLWRGPHQPLFSVRSEWASLLMWSTAVASIHMTIALVMRGFVGWYTDTTLKEELGRRTHEAEMALIRSKLDPHFLFNTLNNIDVLITKDPIAASTYLEQLSDLLRFVLYETQGTAIPLSDELAYIEKYIALERLRTASPRYVVYEVNGDVAGLLIAPMILIPFIENAFKHAEGRRESEAIAIRIDISADRLLFCCGNKHGPRTGSGRAPGGLGNEQIRRRLALLYPGRHALNVADADDTYSVRLALEFDEPLLHRR